MEKTKYTKEYEKIAERIKTVYRSSLGVRNAHKYITGLLSLGRVIKA